MAFTAPTRYQYENVCLDIAEEIAELPIGERARYTIESVAGSEWTLKTSHYTLLAPTQEQAFEVMLQDVTTRLQKHLNLIG